MLLIQQHKQHWIIIGVYILHTLAPMLSSI